jgi:zinc protease
VLILNFKKLLILFYFFEDFMLNKTRLMIYSLVIMIAFYIPSQAQKISGYDMTSKIPLKSEVKTGTLQNGLQYFILQNKKPENRAELQIVIRAGSLLEDDDQAGLAHFTEHMAFNGTKDFPKAELVSFLESTGVRFGADINASTGFDRTYYTITIPLDKDGLLDKGFLVLEDWLSSVSFDEEEINKERGVIMEEWRLSMATANGRVQKIHLPNFLWGSKFASRLPIGDTTIIQTAPRSAFTRFYNDYYRPNISAVIVVGDINVAEIEGKIKKHFADIKNPSNEKPRTEFEIPINPKPIVSIAADKELQMPNYTFIFKRKPDGYPAGTYGEYRSNIIKNLFNTVFQYRLQEISRKSDSPYLFAGGGYDGFLVKSLEAMNLVVVPKLDKMNEAYKKVLEEGFRLTRHGVTKSELDRAKTELLSNMEQGFKEKDKTESAPLAQELYRYFHEQESAPGVEAEYKMYQDFMPEITVQEVNKNLKPLMEDAGLVIAASIPVKDGIKVPTEDELLSLYNDVKKSNIEPYQDVDASKPLMSQKPTPGKITDRKENSTISTKELTLSNGIKVFLKPTEFKNDEILFRGFRMGGTSLASDADFYSANLASSIVDESGLGEFDATTLGKMLQGKIAGATPYISDVSEGITGEASTKDLELMFQMIYMYFNNPRKDMESFKSVMSRMNESIQNSSSSPDRVFSDSISAIMGGYNMRAMPLTLDNLSKVNLDKAFEFYQSRFSNAKDYTFTFVGNFKPEVIEPLIETYLASLKVDNNAKTAFKDNGVRSPKNTFAKEIKKGIEPKSSVRLVINGPIDFNRENRFAIRAMVELMSIRLREVIREDMGGVYGIGARPRIEKYPVPEYAVYVSFGTGPEKVKDLIAAAKGVIEELKAGKFDEVNVGKVKEIMTRENEVSLKDNRYWLNAMYSYQMNGEDMNYILENNKMVEKINKDYIVATAKKYLNMDSFKEFVLNPED